jgi:hypothetical protein
MERNVNAQLRSTMFPNFLLHNAEIAAIISLFMIAQQALLKHPVT